MREHNQPFQPENGPTEESQKPKGSTRRGFLAAALGGAALGIKGLVDHNSRTAAKEGQRKFEESNHREIWQRTIKSLEIQCGFAQDSQRQIARYRQGWELAQAQADGKKQEQPDEVKNAILECFRQWEESIRAAETLFDQLLNQNYRDPAYPAMDPLEITLRYPDNVVPRHGNPNQARAGEFIKAQKAARQDAIESYNQYHKNVAS